MDNKSLPENITDLPGLSEWGKYNGVNVGGVHYTPFEASQNGAIKAIAPSTQTNTLYDAGNGKYSTNIEDSVVGVSLNSDTGKITITMPKEYKDDEKVKTITGDIISGLSSGYKANKNVMYQDPYDENKKIDTAKYVEYLSSALQDRVSALDAVPKTKSWLISQFGNSKEAVDAINSLTADDMITMSATGVGENTSDDSPVAIPQYIQDAFPKIKELESFSNGFAKRGDLLKNWYNVSNGSLTRNQALNIEKFTEGALSANIQDWSGDEIARTLAFGQFLSKNDPTMSGWDAFWTNIGEGFTGFNEGLYSSVATLLDSIVNFTTQGARETVGNITGTTPVIPVKEVLWPENKVASPSFSEQMAEDMYINSGGAQSLAIGYGAGKIGYAAAEMALTQAAASALGSAIAEKIATKGAEKVATTLAEEADAAAAMSKNGAVAQLGAKAGQSGAKAVKLSKDSSGLFASIVSDANQIATKIFGVTQAELQALSPAQMANVMNSALQVVKHAKLANSALGVMSSFTIAATVLNNDLTNKVIRNPEASDEVRTWVKQMAWDTATLEAMGAVMKVGAGQLGKITEGTKVEQVINTVRDKSTKAAEKITDTLTSPYIKFRQWAIDRKMEAQAMSKAGLKNSTLANKQAITEAEVRREYRNWMQTQSTSSTVGETQAAALGDISTPLGPDAVADSMAGITAALGTTVYDPVTETSSDISPFAAAKAGEVRLRNTQTDLGDIQTLETQLISQFSDPDIEPVISDLMSSAADADTRLINMEVAAGLLDKKTIKIDKKIVKQSKKEPYNALFAGHSPEVVKFAVRSQELTIARNEALAKGLKLTPETPGYGEALARYNKAAEPLTPDIIVQINKVVLPSYRKLEHEIMSYAIDPHHAVFPRSLVNGLRSTPKWGTNGMDWIRLAAAKEMPAGTYVPRDRFMQNTTVNDINRDKVLEDDELTWVGNGLNALIREIATSESYRRLVTAVKQADGLVIGTVKTGEETQAAANIKEYEKDFHSTVRKGIKSFTEDMSLSNVVSKLIGKKPIVSKENTAEIKGALSQGDVPKLLERGPIALAADIEHTRASGIMAMDGESVRNVMSDNNIPTSDMIVDQESFGNYYLQSSPPARRVLEENFGEDITEEYNTLVTEKSSDAVPVDFDKLTEMRNKNYSNVQEVLNDADKLNAYDKLPEDNKAVLNAGEKLNKEAQDFWRENIYDLDFSYEVKPEPTAEKNPKAKRGDNLKYKLDEDRMLEDVDDAINGMIELVAKDLKSSLYIKGANLIAGYRDSDARTVFYVLSDVLSKDNKKILEPKIKKIAKHIVDSAIPPKVAVIKGNVDSLYRKAEKLMRDRMVSKLADAKKTLESTGEDVKSDTVKDLLKQYDEDIMGYKSKDIYIQTTDVNGNYEWLEVTPAVGALYNKRPLYKPMGTIQETLANMALLKRISLTNLSPRSFAKQAASDPALSFVTTGSLPIPGMYSQTSQAIAAKFGERIAADIAKYDPRRYANIKEVASREGISIAEAAVKNMDAMAATQAPFTTMSQEVLRQADANRYGTKGRTDRKTLNDRINSGLREVSEKLGTPNDKRELWNRQLAEVKQRYDMLERGYNYAQAEEFGRHALDNATTNFRQKHAVFNALRITVPYLTAGISGAKSFWQMFELDPVGVTTRILTGFVMPIVWLMGEIMEDDELREQYEALAEYEKENHIIIAVGGQLVRIPIGEELGSIVNPLMHTVEGLYGENQYDFWLLMLNDAVGFFPVDLTGFTDPDMWQNIAEEAPSFMEVMDNGISTLLASTMPPVFQSSYMAISGRDLYTGKRIDSNKLTIDNNGDAVIDGWSQSEFSKAMANIIGGDARVIEKVTSGLFGTTALHVLDTITSAVQWIGSGGEAGSLTTAIEKTASDLANPYATHGYNSLEKRWNNEINKLYSQKEEIENSKKYKEYNNQISQETDQKIRQNKINGRNGLLTDFQNRVENLVKGYQKRGGKLNGLKFSQVSSLLTFEGAVRADRAFMHLNTEYSNARALAYKTLYDMGIKNPEGPSMLGYIYYDKNGEEQVKLWTPAQMKIIQDSYYQQGNIHQAHIKAIVESDADNSVKKLKKAEESAEQPYWDKYNTTGKLTNSEWAEIDNLRKAYDSQVVVALRDYIDSYGAGQILNNETVMDYLENIIKVPTEYEKVNGRVVSSGNGKLNKAQGFVRSYTKSIFGVK